MTFIHAAPFLRLLLPFATGIFAGLQLLDTRLPTEAWWLPLCFLLSLSGVGFSSYLIVHRRNVPDLLAHGCLFMAGLVLAVGKDPMHQSDHHARFPAAQKFLLQLTEPPLQKTGYWKATAHVLELVDSSGIRRASGKLLLYIKEDSNSTLQQWKYGDLLEVHGKLQPIPGASYPEQFDYAAMMWARGINRRIFTEPQHIQWRGNEGNPILTLSFQAAYWTGEQLAAHFSPRIAAVLSSLLIGLRSNIEPQDLEAFKNTGTLHVLAVSGMHIALIYGVLMWLMSAVPWRIPSFVTLTFVAVCIWTYACISGFSASVSRAALMCSVMLLGKGIKRNSSLANNLSATAFILLLWEPRWLMDAGFLLSFTAVAGILIFQPLFERRQPKHKIAKSIWNLLSVSLAAQLGTLPVSLYYFHQFAAYFLIGNLLIIPLSTVALFGGLLFLPFCTTPYLGAMILSCTKVTTTLLLDAASWIGSWPNALLNSWYVSGIEAILLCVVLCGCAWYFSSTSAKPWMLLCALLLFAGMRSVRILQAQWTQRDIIFTRQQHGIWSLLLRHGRQAILLSNDTSRLDPKKMSAYLERYQIKPALFECSGEPEWWNFSISEHAQDSIIIQATGTETPSREGIGVWNRRWRPKSLPKNNNDSGLWLFENTKNSYMRIPEKFLNP